MHRALICGRAIVEMNATTCMLYSYLNVLMLYLHIDTFYRYLETCEEANRNLRSSELRNPLTDAINNGRTQGFVQFIHVVLWTMINELFLSQGL